MEDNNHPAAKDASTESFPGKKALKREFEFMAGARSLIAKDIENRIEKALSALATSPTIKTRI
jgi:hypothetical protein